LALTQKSEHSHPKSFCIGEKSLGTDEKSLRTNEKSLGTDEKSLRTDEKSLGTDEKSLGTDEKSLGTYEKSLGTDEKSLGTNEKSLGTDEKSLGTDEKSLRTDEKSFCTNIPVVGAMHSGKVLASPPKLNGRIHRPWANCRIPGQRLWLHRLKTLPDSPTSQPVAPETGVHPAAPACVRLLPKQ